MPINPFEAVVFNEGEPLDPDKLNKLQTNIANTYQTSSTLYNATKGSQTVAYVPIMNSHYVEFEKLEPGVVSKLGFDPGTMFTGIPFVVACLRSDLSKGEQVSVSVINVSNKPEIVIVSNQKRGKTRVDWIAMQKKEIA
jgi:hypothetical protein